MEKKLGFKCGIEIHQQLDTGKLFCGCESEILDGKPDFIVKRKLIASAGETGEIDRAAKHEMAKDKQYVYHSYKKSTCLVELDEEPPHPINQQALYIALQVAELLNSKIIDKIQVMRKTVVDGSNTSGFQRTALIAVDGYLDTSKGKVNIPTICLEEDSAKIVERTQKKDVYNLSRLGIPLIEIATDASIKDPEHAKEVASKLGMILRSTDVKRGLGTIRQDVNLSIKNQPRVEIKGFQDLDSIPKVIEKEVKRQQKLKNPKGEVRKAEPDMSTTYLRPLPGAARMYPETDLRPVHPLKDIKIPKLLTEKVKELVDMGIKKSLAKELARNKFAEFETYREKYLNIEPEFVAKTLITSPKEIKKRYEAEPDLEELDVILDELDQGKISEEAVFELLVESSKGDMNIEKYHLLSDQELEKKIKDIIKDNPKLPVNAMIGKVMGELRGKAPGKRIVKIIRQEME